MDKSVTADNTGTFPTNQAAKAAEEKETAVTTELDFEALLEQYMPAKLPRQYDTVEGTVVAVLRRGVLVDIGQKTESFCDSDHVGNLTQGDTATFIVIGYGEEEGALVLSHTLHANWHALTSSQAAGESVSALVKSVSVSRSGHDAGLIVSVAGIDGFLPRRELAIQGSLKELVNSELPVKVLAAERDIERGRLVSRLTVSHKEAVPAIQDELLGKLTIGGTVEGRVTRIIFERQAEGKPSHERRELGALIDLGNFVTGFVHRSECSFSRSVKPSEVLAIGAVVKADVLNVDLDKREVKLSVRKHTVNGNAVDSLAVGDTVEGVVSHVLFERKRNDAPRREMALLVDLGSGITGFLHRAEVCAVRSTEPSQVLPVGTRISAEITSVDSDRAQVKLSLNPMRRETVEGLKAKKGDQVQGIVAGVYQGVGYYVALGDFVVGLLHNQELRREGHEIEKLTVGEPIDVVVLNVREDAERKRTNIALSRRVNPIAAS